MRTLIILIFVIIFALLGGMSLAIALSGMNIVLPGLGLVITGWFIGFLAGVLFGAIFGFVAGHFISRRII